MYSLPTPVLPSSAQASAPAATLLVVEDDPMVLDLETQVLRLEGYRVLAAQSGAEALQLVGETAMIDLLITDLLMHDMDGLALTHRFRAVNPKTPVLLVSGALQLLHATSELRLDHFDFLAKPLQLDTLLHKIRALLDSAGNNGASEAGRHAEAIQRTAPWTTPGAEHARPPKLAGC